MRLVSVAVLGRVLTPHDFGVVAAALSVLLVLHQVRDIGIGAALIQRQELDREHIAVGFAFSFYLGLVLAALLVVLAPFVGALYGIHESIGVLQALGALFVLRGLSTVPLMICRRAMNFRAIAMIDAATYAAGTSVTIALALGGAGPWSLVGGYLVEEALSGILYIYVTRPPFSLRLNRARLRDLLGFGVGHTLIQVANILAVHGDNFIVGRSLGAGQLGLYARAYELIKLPAAVFTNVVGNVLFPAFSKLQHDRDRLASGFRRATLANALLLVPASAVLVVIAPEAIRVVMGTQWEAAVLPFRILSLTMLMRTSYKVGATVASAAGAVYPVAVANAVYMVAVIGGAAFSIRWGIPGVAASTATAIVIVYLHCSYLGMQFANISAREFGFAHVPGIVAALVATAATWPAAAVLRSAELPAGVVFGAVTALGIVASGLVVLAWTRTDHVDARWLRDELSRVVRRKAKRQLPAPDAG